MVFVGAVILPHGPLPFDNPQSEVQECRERHSKLTTDMKHKFTKLYEGSVSAGEQLAAQCPDLVILHSPHGISVRGQVGVYVNASASGNAEWMNCYAQYTANIEIDQEKSESLLRHFHENSVPAVDILGFSGFGMPLKWGEVVPIWYLEKNFTKTKPKYIVITQNRHDPLVMDGQMEIGKALYSFIKTLDPELRVAVAIGGDLSHTYSTTCTDPLYVPPPKSKVAGMVNDEAAKAFEEAATSWVKSTQNKSWRSSAALLHLDQCYSHQPEAQSCGIQGNTVLHAFLETLSQDTGQDVHSHLFCCEVPTYYGMMAATFIPET